MKKYLHYILFIGLLFNSCEKDEDDIKKEIEQIATEFLRDFYYNSFEFAKASCDKKTIAFLDYIEKNDEMEYRNQYFEDIDSVVLTSKDSALVYYRYENSFYNKDKHVLPVIKQAGRWLVSIENKENIDFYRFVFDYSIEELKVKNYLALTAEELIEVELITKQFIAQVNDPNVIVGYMNKNSFDHYDIPDAQNYSTYKSKYWSDLSSFDLNSSFDFSYDNVLSKLNYIISSIGSHNYFAITDEIEKIITEEYGVPYNNQYMEKDKWYASTKWFVKGANAIIELRNNDNGSIELSLFSSEEETYNDDY